MPRLSIKNISLYGFYAILISGLVSGILIFIFLTKVQTLHIQHNFYDKAHTQLFSFIYHSERLLISHDISHEKHLWWSSKEGVFEYINDQRLKGDHSNNSIWRLWKTIDNESIIIKQILEGKYFGKEFTMDKSILRRLGEELNSSQHSDYYIILSNLRNSIDFLKQYQGFLLDEVHDLKNAQQDQIFTQIEHTKRTGIISVIAVMAFGFVFSGFMANIISKMEKDLLKTKECLKDQLSKEQITVDKYVAISSTDTEGIITYVSTAFCILTGYEPQELIGERHNILASGDTRIEEYTKLWESITTTGSWKGELKNKNKSGIEYWTEININAIRDNEGAISGYYSYSNNITNIKELRNLSITDSLTNLYNRRFFNEIAPKLITGAKRNNSYLALVMIDIDFFKKYNDHYGHQAGDLVLEKVAAAIRNSLTRGDDYSFRLGGEEFAMIYDLEGVNNYTVMAERVRKAVEQLSIEHKENPNSKYITISLGVCVIEPDKNNLLDEIYKKSDQALYLAKNTGKNKVILSGSSQT